MDRGGMVILVVPERQLHSQEWTTGHIADQPWIEESTDVLPVESACLDGCPPDNTLSYDGEPFAMHQTMLNQWDKSVAMTE